MALVVLGASAWSFGQDRPWRGHRLGGLVRSPLGPRSDPRRRTRGGRLAQGPFLSCALGRGPAGKPRSRTKAGIPLFCNPKACHGQLPRGQTLASEMEYVT